MSASSLRENQDAANNESRDDCRGKRAAQIESAMTDGLVEKVANGSAKRSREDERGPEQRYPRHIRPIIGCGDNRQRG